MNKNVARPIIKLDENATNATNKSLKCSKSGKPLGRPRLTEQSRRIKDLGAYFNENKEITITGVAIILGFTSEQALKDEAEKATAFAEICRKAILKVKECYEKQLHRGGGVATGAIFALKNMGWKDSQEVKQEVRSVSLSVDLHLETAIKELTGNE